MTPFNGYLYVGTQINWSNRPCELWRIDQSDNFELVDGAGINSANNYGYYSIVNFNDEFIYVSTRNSDDGVRIYGSSDGQTFTQINTTGFGYSSTNWCHLFLFNNHIYTSIYRNGQPGLMLRSDISTWYK